MPQATTRGLTDHATAAACTVVRAIAPERYKLQVTIGAETRAKLRRAQDLLRHTNRTADEAAVIDRALTVLVEQLRSRAVVRATVRAGDRRLGLPTEAPSAKVG